MRPSIALIGAGRMGAVHLDVLVRDGPFDLRAVVEPSDAAWTAAGKPDVPRHRALEPLLADPPEAALVAVPTRLHVPVVSSLLGAGVAVLCEKPLGLRPADADTLGADAERAGAPLRVGYWRRFVPELQALRARIAAHELGDIQLVVCAQWDERPPPAAFRDPASSGGILVDMAVHEIDEIRWLTGQELVAASGFAAGVHSDQPVPGDPESVALTVLLSGGATALVTLVRRHPPGEVVRLEVVGTADAVRLEPIAPPDGDAALRDALLAQLRDFAQALAGGESAGATAADAAAALRGVELLAGGLAGGRPGGA